VGQVLVIGLVEGTLFGLLALGISLVYRGARTLNFALGEIGTLGLYAFWWLSVDHNLAWPAGALGAIAVAVAVAAAFERLVARSAAGQGPAAPAVASIGLLTALLAFELQVFGESPRAVRPPIAGLGVQVAGVFVSPTQLVGVGVAAVVAAGLGLFLRATDFGLGVLATAEDPDAARLMGIPASRVATFVWGAGGALAALAALLVAPSVGVLTPGFASAHLFTVALAAAVVGGLGSLPGAFVGGLVVGVAKAALLRVFASSTLPGKEYLVYLGIVLALLAVRPQGLVGLRSGVRR
jgi:branched-chain amino acid transport system permease protein